MDRITTISSGTDSSTLRNEHERRWIKWWLVHAINSDGLVDLVKYRDIREFRSLVVEGIPDLYRWKVWSAFSGLQNILLPGLYEELLSNQRDANSEIEQQIEMVDTL